MAGVVCYRLPGGGGGPGLRGGEWGGNGNFDQAGRRATRRGGRFPPLPRAFGESWLGIHFTFSQKK